MFYTSARWLDICTATMSTHQGRDSMRLMHNPAGLHSTAATTHMPHGSVEARQGYPVHAAADHCLLLPAAAASCTRNCCTAWTAHAQVIQYSPAHNDL